MLKKTSRLSAVQVREVLKEGRSLRGAGVSAKYLPSSKGQAAVVVSKSTAKTAVLRNKLRRSAYAALTSLPRARVVFFINTAKFDPNELQTLCSKLSS